jgi:hypothetical protein
MQAAGVQLQTCRLGVTHSPQYAFLKDRQRVALNGRAMLDQLSGTDAPTDEEIAAYRVVHSQDSACDRAFAATVERLRPDEAAVLLPYLDKKDELAVALVQHKLTWARFFQQQDKLLDDFRADMNVVDQAAAINARADQERKAALLLMLNANSIAQQPQQQQLQQQNLANTLHAVQP